MLICTVRRLIVQLEPSRLRLRLLLLLSRRDRANGRRGSSTVCWFAVGWARLVQSLRLERCLTSESLLRLLMLWLLLLLLRLVQILLLLLLLLPIRALHRGRRIVLCISHAGDRDEIDRSRQICPALGVVLCPCLHIRVCVGV